jgi:hypothetical protein
VDHVKVRNNWPFLLIPISYILLIFEGVLLTCSNSASLCKNGATCVNQTTSTPNLGLSCLCPRGYSGTFCDISN